MRRRIALFFLLLIFLAGCLISLFPVINELLYREKMKTTVSEFQSNTEHQLPPVIILPSGDAETTEYTPAIHQELWKDIQQYNRRLFQTRQEGIKGLESLEEACFRLSDYGISSEVFGVLSIPALDLEMPVYLGASSQNMALGAAQLGQTSIPVGGKNTNTVIAGHRGWNGADYFRYITELVPGDRITLTNLWETLEYTVVGTRIISPDDVDAIKIQPEKDMITLFTCHPYASGGRQRYLVFCERINNEIRKDDSK